MTSGATSKIRYAKNHVIKTVSKYLEYDIVNNEVYWLEKIREHYKDRPYLSPFPMLIERSGNKIVMDNCGAPVKKETLPKDWLTQIWYILNQLKALNCSHNDIKPSEILVKNNKIYLCDFGWATDMNTVIPDNWPRGLGGKFVKKIKINTGFIHYDPYSFQVSIEHILKDEN